MRQYTVQAGDSPAKIAIAFAGCPKCTADLIAANPHKQAVRYPNGFVTFKSLSVGERLHLPEKWFNGALDALPKEYFQNLPAVPDVSQTYLPQMATTSSGMGQASTMEPGPRTGRATVFPNRPGMAPLTPVAGNPRYAQEQPPPPTPPTNPFAPVEPRIPLPEIPNAPPAPIPLSRVQPGRGRYGVAAPAMGSRQQAPSMGSRQPEPSMGSRQPGPSMGGRQPAPPPGQRGHEPSFGGPFRGRQFVQPVGRPFYPAGGIYTQLGACQQWAYYGTYTWGSNPINDPVFAAASNSNNTGKTLVINGRLYRFQAVPAPVPQVAIYYCARALTGISRGGFGFRGVGLQGPPAPGAIATPPSNVISPPSGMQFQPQEQYTLVVWPIPLSGQASPDPTTVLTDWNFQVTSISQNSDFSYTANVIYVGSTPVSINPAGGLDYLIFENPGPAISPTFGTPSGGGGGGGTPQKPGGATGPAWINPPMTVQGDTLEVDLPTGAQWAPTSYWQLAYPKASPLPPGISIGVPTDPTGPATVTFPAGTTATSVSGVIMASDGSVQAMSIQVTPGTGGSYFQVGENIVGDSSGSSAQLNFEYDYPNGGDPSYNGVLSLNGPASLFANGETIRGQSSGIVATVKYQYSNVLVTNDGLLGVASASDQGTTLQMPYNLQPGDTASLIVVPMMDASGNIADVTQIITDAGLSLSPGVPLAQNPDCSLSLSVVNNSTGPIEIDTQMLDNTSSASMWVTGVTVSGNVILAPSAPPPQISGPVMSACHAFTLTYIPYACPALTGGPFDPTTGLAQLGLTNYTPPTSGPDQFGQYSVDGVWELGDGFQLPTNPNLTITGYTDNGPAQNVPTGNCATSLPYTIQPGDTVSIIARPIAAPGQPMTNPVAVLEALGFTSVAPAATYSDCTWVLTGTYTGNVSPIPGSPPGQPLQITDPMVSAGVGAMWVVGLAVNGTTIKNANWLALTAQQVTLRQCNAYTVFFTYAICPTLTGAPGSWDPTSELATFLPGFTLAPGPNEYGEWVATGTWTGQDQTTLSGTQNITITFLVDYGASQGCTAGQTPTVPACPSGQVNDLATGNCTDACPDGSAPTNSVCPQVGCTAPLVVDSVTGKCVAACWDGSAPKNLVCPPVKAAAPVTAPTTSTTSAGTVAAVVGGGAVLAGLAYLALK